MWLARKGEGLVFRKKQTHKRALRRQSEEAICASVFAEALLWHSAMSDMGHLTVELESESLSPANMLSQTSVCSVSSEMRQLQ